ncbi:MAG: hypothetical protein V1858_03300 [Candidatus Gottesmanbacteria bacterium]
MVEENINSANPVNPPPNQVTSMTYPDKSLLSSLNKRQKILGLSFVVVLAVFIISSLIFVMTQRSSPSQLPEVITESVKTPLPMILTLDSPSDSLIVTGDQLLVKGQTLPGATVVFYTDDDQNSTEADTQGKFEGNLKLSNSGINNLNVTAYAENGEEKSLAVDLVYDNQVLGVKDSKDKSAANQQNSKQSFSSNKKAIIGDVETVASDSVTIKEGKLGKTAKTSVDKNTKIVNHEKKTLNLEGVKIKDRAAIITDDESATVPGKIKKALKIFVKESTTSGQLNVSKRQAVQGIIKSITGNEITLTHQIQRDRQYTISVNELTIIKIKGISNTTKSATTSATLANLKVGDRIVVVGDRNEIGTLVAKMIHVIPGKATGIYNKYPFGSPNASASASPLVSPSASASASPTASATASASPAATASAIPSPTP